MIVIVITCFNVIPMQHIVSRKAVKPPAAIFVLCDGYFVLFGLWRSASESGKKVGCTVVVASVHNDPQRDESLSFS